MIYCCKLKQSLFFAARSRSPALRLSQASERPIDFGCRGCCADLIQRSQRVARRSIFASRGVGLRGFLGYRHGLEVKQGGAPSERDAEPHYSSVSSCAYLGSSRIDSPRPILKFESPLMPDHHGSESGASGNPMSRKSRAAIRPLRRSRGRRRRCKRHSRSESVS